MEVHRKQGEQRANTTHLTFLLNLDFNLAIASTFLERYMLKAMIYPLSKVKGAEKKQQLATGQPGDKTSDANSKPNDDSFLNNIPEDLKIEDCIVDKTEHATFEEQRKHFRLRMREMAREGHDEEDGWTFVGKTQMQEGLATEDQLEVYEREVGWSKATQLRSVVETDWACDEYFRGLVATFHGRYMHRQFKKALAKEQKKVIDANFSHPFVLVEKESVTALFLKDIPFPWPFSPRYAFMVQDYVLVREKNQPPWFYTYNHDVPVKYFERREGYVRANIRL